MIQIVLISILFVLIAAYLFIGFAIFAPIIASNFARVDIKNRSNIFINIDKNNKVRFFSRVRYKDIEKGLSRRNVKFQSGENTLAGVVYGEGNKGLIIMAHGFGGDSESYIQETLYFTQKGWRVFVFDGTGVNDSGGESCVGLYQAVLDMRAALSYVKTDPSLSGLELVLFGQSQGGFAVCTVMNYPEARNVRAVVSCAGLNRAGDMIDSQGPKIMGAAYWLFRPFILLTDKGNFGKNAPYTAVQGINNTDASVMLFQGTKDNLVTPERFAITHFSAEITNPNVEIIMLSDDWNNKHDNGLSSQDAFNYLAEVNAAFADYLAGNGSSLCKEDIKKTAYEWAGKNIDIMRHSALNPEMFDRINLFFEKAVN